MSFKKQINANTNIKVLSVDNSTVFPVGFSYISGGELYTVVKSFSETNTEWRRLRNARGDEEDVMLSTIYSDLREEGAKAVDEEKK